MEFVSDMEDETMMRRCLPIDFMGYAMLLEQMCPRMTRLLCSHVELAWASSNLCAPVRQVSLLDEC